MCANIYNGSFVEEQEVVQKATARVQMVSEVLKSVPAVLLTLFFGPWSDRFGRKYLLVVSDAFAVVALAAYAVNVYLFDLLPAEFLWLDAAGSLGGGWMTFWLGVYSLAGDVTSERSRTFRIAFCDAVSFVTTAASNLANGLVFRRLGYYGSFGAGAGFTAASILYVLAFFEDGPAGGAAAREGGFEEEEGGAAKVGGKNPISLRHLRESLGSIVAERPHSLRHILVLLIGCWSVSMLVFHGVQPVEYLYIR